jgi:hypothetical protein
MAYCPYNWNFDIECTSECALYKNGSCTLRVDTSAMESVPPTGKFKVTNLFVDPSTGRLTVEYDDEPVE